MFGFKMKHGLDNRIKQHAYGLKQARGLAQQNNSSLSMDTYLVQSAQVMVKQKR
jgi:hypothetical protein